MVLVCPRSQDYKARGVQLMLCNPSPRVVRLMERSDLINKIGREWIFVRVHDAVVACQRSLIQMEAGGSMGPPVGHSLSSMWQPVHVAALSNASDPLENLPPSAPSSNKDSAGAGRGTGKDADA